MELLEMKKKRFYLPYLLSVIMMIEVDPNR